MELVDLKKRKKGDIYTWGWNNYGQLGCGEIGSQNWKPIVGVELKKKFVTAASSFNFALAFTSGGEVASWGLGECGQLGQGDKGVNPTPKKISSLKKGAIGGATGSFHALLVKRQVFSWGQGESGQLGHGDNKDYSIPTLILALKGKKVTSVSAGAEHSVIIADGNVYSWGLGEFGRLGLGNEKNQSAPTLVESLQNQKPKEIICGSDWTTVLCENGDVFTFGYGANGRLGVGNDQNQLLPIKVDGLTGKGIIFIACGHDHTIAISSSNEIYAYGYGGNGRLGNGSELDEKVPKEIETLKGKGIYFVACGGYHSAAISTKGELYTWGWNHFGQLGYEGSGDQYIPTIVTALKGKKVVWVSCGEGHTIAVVTT